MATANESLSSALANSSLAKITSREVETNCRSIFPFSSDEATKARKVKQLVFGDSREAARNIKTYKLPALNICDLDSPYLDDDMCDDEEDMDENVLEDIQRDEEADHLGLLRVLNSGRNLNGAVQKDDDVEDFIPLNLLRVSSAGDTNKEGAELTEEDEEEVLVENEAAADDDDDEWTVMDQTDDETSSQWTSVTSDFSVQEMNFLTAAKCGSASVAATNQTEACKGTRASEKTNGPKLSTINEDNGMDFVGEYSKFKADGDDNFKHGKMRRGRSNGSRRRKNRR